MTEYATTRKAGWKYERRFALRRRFTVTRRAELLSPELYHYLRTYSSQPDRLLLDLAAETQRAFSVAAGMQISHEQGAFLAMLTRLTRASRALEIGTFTGYSAICIARGLAESGKLTCCDSSEKWTSLARRYWRMAGLSDRIELRLGPAADTLRALPADETFDLVFIDADKTGYIDYWESIVPRVRSGGVILADNTLSGGRVMDPANVDESVRGIRAFNDHVLADARVERVLLPIGDGLTLARKW
jgi:caffeoyl-CoA O-methyltransferase